MAENSYTRRNRFSRLCIGEAIISLLQDTPYDKITISDITKKAGFSRMTFYKYYQTKTDALIDYLNELISDYLQACATEQNIGNFFDETHILHALTFFDQYANFFLTLQKAHLYHLIIDAINNFMLKHVYPFFNRSVYELYYYSGALLNVFLNWEIDNKKEPVEKLAHTIYKLLH